MQRAKEAVLAVYPKAYAMRSRIYEGKWIITVPASNRTAGGRISEYYETEAPAWIDAASCLAPTREVEEAKKYLPWQYAGGPNECKHGYAEGIPCPDCDRAASPEPKPQQQVEGQPTEEIPKALTFEGWWDSIGRHSISGFRTNAKQVARFAWAAAKGGR